MEYHEAVNFLFDLRRFQVKPGTESVRALLSALDDPHEDVTFVQVAGSNGKGSTARMVEAVLRETDRRVGLYTSPHFDDVRERVRVDGRKIPEHALVDFVSAAKPYLVERAAAGEPLTFFETMTAMALWYYGRADVDVAVLEVGMGGELDATSVVDPVASAVTNVSLEHTAVLGDTIEEIATTKAHVAPREGTLVTAATGEALDAIRAQAGDVLRVGTDADADVTVAYDGRVSHVESAVRIEGPAFAVETRIPVLGAYQAANAGIAAVLARQVADVSAETLARGMRNAHWPGRFEVMGRDPLVVLDGAHNPGACEGVTATLAEFDYDALYLVFGAMHDKDHREMVAALPTPDGAWTCRPNLDRAEDPDILARVFGNAGVEARVESNVAAALRRARAAADAGDAVVLTGSLFCVAEARAAWTRRAIRTDTPDRESARTVLDRAHVPDSRVAETVDDAVHRTITTKASRREARAVREALIRAGGDCALSGHDSDGELVDVVLTGTLAQFETACDALESDPRGPVDVTERVRSQLTRERDGRGHPWEERPCVMGILNVTPDSFHDGGEYAEFEDAVARAERMVDNGVDIIDIGGESTRPGAATVSADRERERVVPVIEAISHLDVTVSIDTRKASVGRAALDAGADVLNDVTGLADPEMRFLAAERDVPIIVMHSIDAPVDPDRTVAYDDVVTDVIDELGERVLLAEKAGLDREQVIVDPGLGFGKSRRENFALLSRLDEFHALGCPVLIGHSYKSMFDLLGRGADDGGTATVAATALAVERGADIVRVHDVRENVAAVRAVEAARDPSGFSVD